MTCGIPLISRSRLRPVLPACMHTYTRTTRAYTHSGHMPQVVRWRARTEVSTASIITDAGSHPPNFPRRIRSERMHTSTHAHAQNTSRCGTWRGRLRAIWHPACADTCDDAKKPYHFNQMGCSPSDPCDHEAARSPWHISYWKPHGVAHCTDSRSQSELARLGRL
jgi:hypothetical protein